MDRTPERLVTCPCCDGSGIEVYGISIREPGCHFSHDSSDERECPECEGLGFYVDDAEPDDENGDFTTARWGEHSLEDGV